jgi:hypothetical protein
MAGHNEHLGGEMLLLRTLVSSAIAAGLVVAFMNPATARGVESRAALLANSKQFTSESALLTADELLRIGLRGTYGPDARFLKGAVYSDVGVKGLLIQPGRSTSGFRLASAIEGPRGVADRTRDALVAVDWEAQRRSSALDRCGTISMGGEYGLQGKPKSTSPQACHVYDTAMGNSRVVAYVWTPDDQVTIETRISIIPNTDASGRAVLSKKQALRRAVAVAQAQYRKLNSGAVS